MVGKIIGRTDIASKNLGFFLLLISRGIRGTRLFLLHMYVSNI